MEVEHSDSNGSGDSLGLCPAEELKNKLGSSGDADPKLCNGDVKRERVNGQNGRDHREEEEMETDDLSESNSVVKKDDESKIDLKDTEKESADKEEEETNSCEGESDVKSNGTAKSDCTDSKESKQVDEDSKSSTDDNKENEGVKAEKNVEKEDESSQDQVDKESSKDGSDKDSESKRSEEIIDSKSPTSEKEGSTSKDEKEGSSEKELEKELKKPTEAELKLAADVDQREKKLKRIEDAAKDNDDLRPVAKLLYGIGMDLGAQHIYRDLVRAQTKKQTMNKLDKRGNEQLDKLKETHKKLDDRNKAYQLKMRSCDRCGFKTESKNVIEWHLEFAHGQDEGKYACSFCDFETRLPAPFFFHMEAEHTRKGRVFMKKAFFSCPQCPYENNSKNAVTRHRLKCDKQFSLKRNQEPLPTDCDIPLKKPKSIVTKRVQPVQKPIVSTNTQLKNYLDTRSPQQSSATRQGTSVVRVSHPTNQTVQTILSQQQARNQMMNQTMLQNTRPRIISPQTARPTTQQIQGPGGQMYTLVNSLMVQPIPQAYPTTILPQVRPGQSPYVQQQQQQSPQAAQQQQPTQNVSQIAQQVVAQVTQQHSAAQQQKAIQDILKRAQNVPGPASPMTRSPAAPDNQPHASPGGNPKFEICEICGGFVKDRESLRIHFYWAHKVDIQKDVFARLNPHLKCDSCTQSFWTYQGLARHRQISHVRQRERNYRCYLCGAKNIENIITHLSAAHNVKLNTMYKTGKCLVCGLGFAGEKGLKRHIHTAHLELLKGTPDAMLGSTAPPSNSPSPVPPKQVPQPMLKAPAQPTKSGPPVPTGLFENSAKKKKFEPVCSLCNIVFPSVESFTMHCNKLHVFKCWRCSDKWASAELLSKHWHEKHRQDQDPCPLCNEKVTIGRPTVRHMKRSHLKECSVVVVKLSDAKFKFHWNQLQVYKENKNKPKPPKPAEVIVLESDDEEVEEVKDKSVKKDTISVTEIPTNKPQEKEETADKEAEKSIPEASKPYEVMEVDGEKIVVQVSQDDDDEEEDNEVDAQNKEKEEKKEEAS